MSDKIIPIRSSLEELLRNTIDSSMDMIQVFKAVRDDKNEIVDFISILNNKASEAIHGDVIGKSLLTLNPGLFDEGIFELFRKVVETGQPEQSIRHYIHEQSNTWFAQSIVKQGDGVVTTAKNITDIQQAETQIGKSTDLLQSVLSNTSSSIMLLRPLHDDEGNIIDFEYRYINEHALQSVSREGLVGKRFTQEFPGLRGSPIWQRYIDVISDNGEWSGETHINFDGFDVWAQVYAKKLNGDLLVTYFDITSKKKAEQEILQLKDEIAQRAEDKYRTLFESIDEGYLLADVIFDKNDRPIDIFFVEANPAAVRIAGRDFTNRWMREIDPLYEEYWYGVYGKVALTGEPVRAEHYAGPHNQWFDFHVSKVQGPNNYRVAVVFQDVTERKQREEAVRSSEERLRRVLDGMGEGFGLLAPDFTILEHNREALRMDGRSREEIVGHSHWEIYPGTEDSDLGRLLKKAMFKRVSVSLEHQYAWKDNHVLWLEMRAYPTFDGLLAVFWRDVTARMVAQDALRKSEEKYRTLFNSIDEGFCVIEVIFDKHNTSRDYRFLEVNASFERQTDLHNAAGKTMRELQPEHEEHWFRIYGEVASTGSPRRFQQKAEFLGNRWYDVFAFPIDNPEENHVAILFNDVTESKKSSEALRQSEANFRTLSDAVPQIIWVNDENGKAVYFNQRWFQYTGLSFEESSGGGWLYIVHPDDASASKDRWKSALEKGDTFDTNYRLRRHDGKYCWHLARNVPLKSDNGEIIGWFGSATDIEDLKRTEQLQQEFIGIASHELKTPLTSIISYVELIAEMLGEQENDSLMKFVSKLTVQVGRMANLINQLLDITRLEHGRLKYNKTNFDIKFLVTDVAEEVLTIAGSRKINVNTGEGAMVMADTERIRQVLVNLVSNAVKYSKERTNIDVSMQVDKNIVTVAVADQGSGIASHELPHVFEKFFRGKTYTAGGAAGLGLGLFISSEIIKDHGGSILVESEEGRGSTFKFTLPIYILDNQLP